MNVALLRNGILIKASEEVKTKSGFLLADQGRHRPNEGTVVSVGPGIDDLPVQCVPGDVILYNHFATADITLNDEKYLYITENNLLGIK